MKQTKKHKGAMHIMLTGSSALSLLLSGLMFFTSCMGSAADTGEKTMVGEASSEQAVAGDIIYEDTSDDYTFEGYDENDCTSIVFTEGSAVIKGEGVTADGSDVTITEKGTYVLSGESSDGSVTVDVESGKVKLVLGGVKLTKEGSAAINVISAKEVTLSLLPDTTNSFADSGEFIYAEGEDEPDAVIFSKDDLVINGTGTLTVAATYKNGIKSKDTLTVAEGILNVTAANNGIVGKDYVNILGGTLSIDAKNHGIKSTEADDATLGYIKISGGSIKVTAGDTAINAETEIYITGGEFDIVSGGGSANAPVHTGGMGGTGFKGGMNRVNGNTMPDASARPSTDVNPKNGSSEEVAAFAFEGKTANAVAGATPVITDSTGDTDTADDTDNVGKGIKASSKITIMGGIFTLDTSDDALHTNGAMEINGGTFTVKAGDDAFHADSTLTVNDGTIAVSTCYEGIESEVITVNGGSIGINATDDAVNAAKKSGTGTTNRTMMATEGVGIVINGGKLVLAAGCDGLDSNGTLDINGGEIYISTVSRGGEGAIDPDGKLTVTGGKIFAAGPMGLGGSLSVSDGMTYNIVTLQSSVPAGTELHITDSDGKVLLSQSFTVAGTSFIVASDEIKEGEAYMVTSSEGGKLGEFTASKASSSVGGGMGGGTWQKGGTGTRTRPDRGTQTLPDGAVPHPNGKTQTEG